MSCYEARLVIVLGPLLSSFVVCATLGAQTNGVPSAGRPFARLACYQAGPARVLTWLHKTLWPANLINLLPLAWPDVTGDAIYGSGATTDFGPCYRCRFGAPTQSGPGARLRGPGPAS